MRKKEEIGYGILGLFILVSAALMAFMLPFEPITTYAVADTGGVFSSFSNFVTFVKENFIIMFVVFIVIALGLGGMIYMIIQHRKAREATHGIPAEQLESLHNYVKETMEKGFSRDQVKKALKESGWKEKVAEALVSRF